jgi:AcrR family transcriptional regulator
LSETENKQVLRIAGAFEKSFRHYGFKKTTVDEIALEIGVSKKTIYQHFRSKEDIFRFIISRKAQQRLEMVEDEIENIESAWGKLEKMITINLTEFRKIHKKKKRIPDNIQQSEMASRIFKWAFFGLLKKIVEEGIEKDEFEVCDTDKTVKYIQALITESMFWIVEDLEAQPDEYLICVVKKILSK